MARLFRRIGEKANDGQRLWIELPVTRQDIRRGMNASRPGMKLFTGLWYGNDPLDHKNYGKILEPEFALPVGRVGRNPSSSIRRRLS